MKKTPSRLLAGLVFGLVIVLSLPHCTQPPKAPAKPYFLTQYRDTTVKPGDDFFSYAIGNFIKTHPIEPSEIISGIFLAARDTIQAQLRGLCEKSAAERATAPKGSNTQKIGDFFATGMDTAAINAAGTKPLQPYLDKIAAIKTPAEALSMMAEMHTWYIQPLFSFRVGQDDKISDQNAAFLYQGGLGLPDRDYYFNKDARTGSIREAYVRHVARMFELLGDQPDQAALNSKTVMRLETALAAASRKLEDLRDPYRNYNKMANADFAARYPALDWPGLRQKMNVAKTDSVIVGQPEFFAAANKLIQSTPVADWQTYLRWHLVNDAADCLSSDFDNEHFNFFGKILSGQQVQRVRWKRVVSQINNVIGDILGQEYVKANFSPEDKKRCEDIVNNMATTYADHIRALDWMTPGTKEKALVKLNTILKKVGYPERWRDYSALEIDPNSYAVNCYRAAQWQYNYDAAKLGKPVDRSEWEMTPQTYNAYYNPSNNEIVLPAAQLLTPGVRFSECDEAYLYGYIAASTVGHEMTHGFDDQGRLYDAKGNLSNWWTSADSAQFSQKAEALVKQFNQYLVLDSLHVNGKATLGENIADLGGLAIAYDAYKRTPDGKANALVGGLTGDQRFFMGYAYSWMVFYRPEEQARRIMVDVHSPAFLRVNGPFSNTDAFYTAFGVKEGDKMYRQPADRVKIW